MAPCFGGISKHRYIENYAKRKITWKSKYAIITYSLQASNINDFKLLDKIFDHFVNNTKFKILALIA